MADCSHDTLNQLHTAFERFTKMSYQDINNDEFHTVVNQFKSILQSIMICHTASTDVNSNPIIRLLSGN